MAEKAASKNWFAKHKVLTAVIAIVLIFIFTNMNKDTAKPTAQTKAATTAKQSANSTSSKQPPKSAAAKRQVKGTAVTLGAGTYTGGSDIAVGLYDVTAGAGQSGNFMVDGTDSYNEILGDAGAAGGVPKVRVQISSGDKIELSGLSGVTFTPVTAPFVTGHANTTLYSGTFIVGQDIGAGRYVASPGAGQSGNFMVDGTDIYNEILGGDSSLGGVPSVNVTLTNGDSITISGLSQVILTAK